VSIHSEHPFRTPEPGRDPARRLRGRLSAPVTVWTTGDQRHRVGLTVSSMLVSEGDPAEVVGLVNVDADLAEAVLSTRTVAVSVLGGGSAERRLADVFAGLAPSPGGIFRTGSWTDTDWGPVYDDAVAWAGARLLDGEPAQSGWALLVRARIEHIEFAPLTDAHPALTHLRGRYHSIDW
jgi:flavin reductase (DIM6/NTAB) family NADH-FMN oxidoreductase RutF